MAGSGRRAHLRNGSLRVHSALYTAGRRKHDHDDQQNTNNSAWAISPGAAVASGRKRTDQEQDGQHYEDRRKHLESPRPSLLSLTHVDTSEFRWWNRVEPKSI